MSAGRIPNNGTAAIQSTIVTTKGDILAATSASAISRLAVGATNGMVLTVDSAEATGLKYATPASAVVPILTKAVMGGDFTTSSTSYVDITGMTITRTPVSATNNIQITATMNLNASTASVRFRLVYGATNSNVIATTVPFNAGGNSITTIVFNVTNVAASSTVFKLQMLTDVSVTVYGNSSGFLNSYSVLEVY